MSRPVLRADGAADVRLLAVSFGVTLVRTRLYLNLAGWPQIGGGDYHIAHALWGGLLLRSSSSSWWCSACTTATCPGSSSP